MADTNINAYKQELVVAQRDLDRAQARVDGLKSYIESVEPRKAKVVKASEETAKVIVKKKPSRKGKK